MRRHSALALFSIIGGLLLALSGPGFGPASVAFRSLRRTRLFRLRATRASALPTSDKPQSKLWFNDGRWWGSLYNKSSANISHLLARPHQPVDQNGSIPAPISIRAPRRRPISCGTTPPRSCTLCRAVPARMPGLCAIATTQPPSSTRATSTRLSYASGGGETIVLDKDSTGKLWVTYTQGNKVYVNRSTTSDSVWGAPFVVPGAADTQCRRYLVDRGLSRIRMAAASACCGATTIRHRRMLLLVSQRQRPGYNLAADPDDLYRELRRRRSYQPEVAAGRRQRHNLRGRQNIVRRWRQLRQQQ